MIKTLRWPLVWRKNHESQIAKLKEALSTAENTHNGYIVECPTNGAILCVCYDSAEKAKKGAQAISKHPNSVYGRSALLKHTGGRWHR